MDTPQPVSALILSHNSEQFLSGTVQKIQAQTYPIQELWILDDASSDQSFHIAIRLVKRVYQNPSQKGRGHMRSLSIEGSTHPFILSCDAAVHPTQDCLEKGMAHFKDARVAAVFGRLEDRQTNPSYIHRWRKRYLLGQEKTYPYTDKASLQTGAVIFRKAAILEVGNFNKNYVQAEDKELGERLLKASWKIVYDPNMLAELQSQDSILSLLERYWRWNSPADKPLSICSYFKQMVYSIKVMAWEDLKRKDYACMGLSLLCPHYQFLKSWIHYLKLNIRLKSFE